MSVQVKGVEAVDVAHPDQAKTHPGVHSGDQDRGVAEILSAVNAHRSIAEVVKKLQIPALAGGGR